MPAAELAGVTVLVTRPSGQADSLCRLITERGGQCLHFPAIEIVPVADDPKLNTLIDDLDQIDIAIFISTNAVDQGIPYIKERGRSLAQHTAIAAIGASTARALERHGLTATIIPGGGYDSEALLATPALRAVEGKNILIFRGTGGRPLLGEHLLARGAQVRYAECYHRQKPNQDPQPLIRALLADEITLATVTSGEGIENLLAAVGEQGAAALRALPLVVISHRLATVTADMGFTGGIQVANGASDQAIVDAIQAWHGTQKPL